jgi:hypothetical protein
LVISWIIPSPEFLELLIEIIHLNVFQSVYFKCPSESTPTLPMGLGRQMPLALVRVCLESSIVQRLTVSHVTIDHETAALFQEQSRRLDTALRELEFFTCKFEDGRSFSTICNCIQGLRHLETLKFWHNNIGVEHDQMILWQCLQDHPSLTKLDWMERPEMFIIDPNNIDDTSRSNNNPSINNTTSRMVANVLGSPLCKIRVLGLSLGNMGPVGSLLSQVECNESVEWLDLSYNGSSRTGLHPSVVGQQQIFGNLHKWKKLRYLDLFCTSISQDAFDPLMESPVPSLERIGSDLWDGSSSSHIETVQRLLATHPTFVEFHGGLHLKTPTIQFLVDTRMVLPPQSHDHTEWDGTRLPPGLWPLILARPNHLLPSGIRRNQVLHWLIHEGGGPAFMALPL